MHLCAVLMGRCISTGVRLSRKVQDNYYENEQNTTNLTCTGEQRKNGRHCTELGAKRTPSKTNPAWIRFSIFRYQYVSNTVLVLLIECDGDSWCIIPGVPDGILDKRPVEGFGHKNTIGHQKLVPPQLLPVRRKTIHKKTFMYVLTDTSTNIFYE